MKVVQRNKEKQHTNLLYMSGIYCSQQLGMAVPVHVQPETFSLPQPPEGQQSLTSEIRSATYLSGKKSRQSTSAEGQNEVTRREEDLYINTHTYLFIFIYICMREIQAVLNKSNAEPTSICRSLFVYFIKFWVFIFWFPFIFELLVSSINAKASEKNRLFFCSAWVYSVSPENNCKKKKKERFPSYFFIDSHWMQHTKEGLKHILGDLSGFSVQASFVTE